MAQPQFPRITRATLDSIREGDETVDAFAREQPEIAAFVNLCVENDDENLIGMVDTAKAPHVRRAYKYAVMMAAMNMLYEALKRQLAKGEQAPREDGRMVKFTRIPGKRSTLTAMLKFEFDSADAAAVERFAKLIAALFETEEEREQFMEEWNEAAREAGFAV
jgi:hypothetical protein